MARQGRITHVVPFGKNGSNGVPIHHHDVADTAADHAVDALRDHAQGVGCEDTVLFSEGFSFFRRKYERILRRSQDSSVQEKNVLKGGASIFLARNRDVSAYQA